MERAELLMREYETITTQIVHWDTFFWHKGQFFLAIESVLLAVMTQQLTSEVTDTIPMLPVMFFMIAGVTLFNLFLCYVWFRTNRSNHEYLKVRFERALQLEDEPELRGVVQLYHLQLATLRSPKYVKHSSSMWERHLPSAFMLAWIAVLAVASFDSTSLVQPIVAGIVFLAAIGGIIFSEKTGWPRRIREKIIPTHDQQTRAGFAEGGKEG
jgi:hypothetical protein